jgi:sec-independent protein translocase protein TatA
VIGAFFPGGPEKVRSALRSTIYFMGDRRLQELPNYGKEGRMGDLFAPSHMLWILLIVVLLFGSKKIPDLAKGLGQGIKEFKKATKDAEKEITNSSAGDKKPDPEKKDG